MERDNKIVVAMVNTLKQDQGVAIRITSMKQLHDVWFFLYSNDIVRFSEPAHNVALKMIGENVDLFLVVRRGGG